MDIIIRDRKSKKACTGRVALEREYGPERGKLIGRRLDEFRAAGCLADIRTLPQARAHELTGNRKGQLSVDLDQPYRLIFTIANEPVPRKPDGGLDWAQVSVIVIEGVVDTHG